MKIKTLTIVLLSISLKVSAQNYIINTLAGNGTGGYSGDGGPAFSAQLSSPSVVAFDAFGNKYIADAANNCIRKIDASGIITTVAGTDTAGYSGDGGFATLAKLSNPWGIALDSLNNLYIADTYNSVIRKIDHTTGIITTIAGNGNGGYNGDGGQADSTQFLYPAAVTLDRAGNIYVADYANNRIRKIDCVTNIVSTIVGTGNESYSGDGGAATAADISAPTSLVFDATGNLYVVDNINSVIRKIDTAGIISTFAGTGVAGYSGDGGQAILAQINGAFGVGVDLAGNVLIADYGNSRVRQVDTAGIITSIAGNGTYGFVGDGGLATTAMMSGPNGVSVDKNGIIYIADWDNNRVRTLCMLPSISMQPLNSIVCKNDSVIFKVVASGNQLTYQWQEKTPAGSFVAISNGGIYSGVTTATLSLSGVTTSMAYNTYICILSSICSSDTSNPVLLGVNNLPTISITGTDTICSGQTATLTASGATTYTWNTTATTFSITSSPTVTTTYTVTGANINNCVNMDTVSITVNSCNTNINQLIGRNEEVTVFPNPNNGYFTVYSGRSSVENLNISVFNSLGQKVFETANTDFETKIGLPDYPKGMYYLQIKTSITTSIKKVIIN